VHAARFSNRFLADFPAKKKAAGVRELRPPV